MMTGTGAGERAEAEPLEDLKPVLAGEHDVEDDELRHALLDRGERARSPFSQSLGLKAGGAQGVDL